MISSHKQGQTVKAGQKVIIHWSKDLAKAMAYVMLGRCELLEDLYIAGEFDVKRIICDIEFGPPLKRRSSEPYIGLTGRTVKSLS